MKPTATDPVILKTSQPVYNGRHLADYVESPDPEKGTRVVHAVITTRTPCGRLYVDGYLDYREYMASQEYEQLFHASGVASVSGINPDGVPKESIFRERVEGDGELRAAKARRDAESEVGFKDSPILYHVAGYGTAVEMVAWRYGKRPDEIRGMLKRALGVLADLWRY